VSRKDWESNWRGGPDYPWNLDLQSSEIGSAPVEDLYQAFKQRLMAELVAERPAAPILGDPDFVAAAELYKLVEIK
jgi:hypothetical protein